MRVQMRDAFGGNHQINSTNLWLIGQWFSDKALEFASADTRYNHPVMLDIWPETQQEFDMLGSQAQQHVITPDAIFALTKSLLEFSEKLGTDVGN